MCEWEYKKKATWNVQFAALVLRRRQNQSNAVRIATPATPPTVAPAIVPGSVDGGGAEEDADVGTELGKLLIAVDGAVEMALEVVGLAKSAEFGEGNDTNGIADETVLPVAGGPGEERKGLAMVKPLGFAVGSGLVTVPMSFVLLLGLVPVPR